MPRSLLIFTFCSIIRLTATQRTVRRAPQCRTYAKLSAREYSAILRLRQYRLLKEDGAAPEPLLSMSWNYANPECPGLAEVAHEINGCDLDSGKQLSGSGELKDDGSTIF